MPRSAADARGRLMQSARRRFAADGALAATLDEVRRDAEVSVGALYHHFPDKPALAAAVYAQVMGEYQSGFVAMLRRHDSARGRNPRWRRPSSAVGCRQPRRGGAAAGGPAGQRRAARSPTGRSSPTSGTGGGRISTYGALRPMHAGVTAALWFGPAQEFSRYWIAGDEPRMPRGVVKTFADAAWKALRANVIQEED